MHKYLIILITGLCISVACSSKESADNMKQYLPDEINGWESESTDESYDRQSIFKYINGAGEVYNSYAFSKVDVFRFTKENAPEISVEIFDMGNDADAYGVFSYSRENEKHGIGQAYEELGSLICFWQGKYYVCVKAEESTDESKETVKRLAQMIDSHLPPSGGKPPLLQYIPEEGLNVKSIRYLHTPSALNYHYYLSIENFLHLDSATDIVIAEYGVNQTVMILIDYHDAALRDQAMNNFINGFLPELRNSPTAKLESGNWATVRSLDNHLAIVMEAPSEERATAIINLIDSEN